MFLLPVFVFLAIYLLYPIINTFQISLYSWSGLVSFKEAIFIGFKNYSDLMHDWIFWIALKNTTIYLILTLIFRNFFGFTLALALYYSSNKAGKLWRAIIFFPAVLSPVIIGLIFKLIFAKVGPVNDLLRLVGLDFLARPWLGVPTTGIYVIAIVNIWQWSGFDMVLYYAGLQSVDVELFEAARLDGANEWQVISKIILPLLSGIITLVMVLNIIGGLKVFEIVYVMTLGGPAYQTEVLTHYAYRLSFGAYDNKMGLGAAVSIALSIIIFVVSLVRLKIVKED